MPTSGLHVPWHGCVHTYTYIATASAHTQKTHMGEIQHCSVDRKCVGLAIRLRCLPASLIPEFHPQNPQNGKRGLTPHKISFDFHMHIMTHMPTLPFLNKINAFKRF